MQKLQQEFTTELATLRNRVDAVEVSTAKLEQQQFSTTTKLSGEAVFAPVKVFGQDSNKNDTVLQERVLLSLVTSFTGKDQLATVLAAGNTPNNYGGLQLTGTAVANTLAGQTSLSLISQPEQPVVMNSYGVELSYQLSPKFAISGWFGASYPRLINRGDGEILYYALTFSFPDFARKGNLLAFIFGAEPYLTHFDGGKPQPFKTDIPLHIEALYQYQLTPNISLTPGLVWLTAPNQDNRNGSDVITTLRATFSF